MKKPSIPTDTVHGISVVTNSSLQSANIYAVPRALTLTVSWRRISARYMSLNALSARLSFRSGVILVRTFGYVTLDSIDIHRVNDIRLDHIARHFVKGGMRMSVGCGMSNVIRLFG